MNVTSTLLGLVIILNIFLAALVLFKERRDPGSTWAWLLVLYFIPVVGFVLYLLFGRQGLRKNRLFHWEDMNKIGVEQRLHEQSNRLRDGSYPFRGLITRRHKDVILMSLLNNRAILSEDNQVEIITDGEDKFNRLFRDIEAAREYIHLQYYILQNDKLGNRLIEVLTKKALEGVKVRVLYDTLGSRSLTKRFFRELRAAGGRVEAFFPSKLRFINLRLNYRNHRKLVIIDGLTGYVGGFNVGDEYLGLHPKFGYWRDTHLRIQGGAVYALQTRFILDWNQASSIHDINYSPKLYPELEAKGNIGVQIVTSGPASKFSHIKNGYLKLIMSAQHSIYIQSPYFIPDASILDALRIAALSGVQVNIMIPDKPDHPFVYWATLSYIGELLRAGANVYHYNNGFMHAKTIVVDDEVATVGTANMDVRSFSLNFEVNAFIYDAEIARSLSQIFKQDMLVSSLLTLEEYNRRSGWVRFKEAISRLVSPIL
jgi:cardiolipin synthase